MKSYDKRVTFEPILEAPIGGQECEVAFALYSEYWLEDAIYTFVMTSDEKTM